MKRTKCRVAIDCMKLKTRNRGAAADWLDI
jgi:hypothetical protein